MTESYVPRVNLPGVMPQKMVVPGPNSWAQQQQQEGQLEVPAPDATNESKPTNRDKYEHKPMPPIPPSEKSVLAEPTFLPPKAYIQPAIPLLPPPSNTANQKMRAVTDPVPPKPLFAGRKMSVSQLRKKYSQSKDHDEPTKEGQHDDNQAASNFPATSEKAAKVLGIPQTSDSTRNTPSTSTPTVPTPDLRQSSFEEIRSRAATPVRQVQSSPVPTKGTAVPTKRYLEENNLHSLVKEQASRKPTQQRTSDSEIQVETSKRVPENRLESGHLLPARIGVYTNVGEVGLVHGAGMHRIESFQGVIEGAPTPNSSHGQSYTNSHAPSSYPNTGESQMAQNLLPPDPYSPSNYGGVWENDPAVGHTLPPFTPMPKSRSSNAGESSRYVSPLAPPHLGPGQEMAQGAQYSANRFSSYQSQTPSGNSWASNNVYGNPVTASNGLPPAFHPSHWQHYRNTNSVPSPPQNQQDFQRAGSLTAALAQIDLTLHHHIDTTFNSLSRLITDKHDRVIDQTIRRLESLEEALSKGFRNMRNDIRDIRKSVGNLQTDCKDIKTQQYGNNDLVRTLNAKLQALEKQIEEHVCKNHYSPALQSGSELESDRANRSRPLSRVSQRRPESVHSTVGHAETGQQDRGGVGHATNSTRAKGISSRRDRSNTINSQPSSSRISDERSNRREYFAELGAARGPVPDIRDHPAFANSQQGQDQGYGYRQSQNSISTASGGLPYNNPSLSNGGWYQQAYGQHV
ncbi:hypothetical protein ACLMJK_005023 [Lecanora helva]